MHLLFFLALYFLPAIVAHSRHNVHAVGITLVNLFFGWTGIGWIAALLWAALGTSRDICYCHPQHYYAARYPRYPAR